MEFANQKHPPHESAREIWESHGRRALRNQRKRSRRDPDELRSTPPISLAEAVRETLRLRQELDEELQ